MYDNNGDYFGLTYLGFNFYYIKNAQNDVIGISNQNGMIIVEYDYDAWGNVTSITGNLASTLGELNPIRYRSYYYDNETGYYHLKTRYYNPVIGRFINADSQLNSNSILGNNLFAYCENNPIMYTDPTGHSLLAIIGLGILLIGMIVGFTASAPINNSDNSNVQYSTNKNPINPNVPPNPESGYVPPKKNPNPGKVKNPNGAGKGWPSNNGGVWIPNNKQDGGPGWTVQFPGGGHEHRYPNGHIRSHKFSNSNSSLTGILIGGSIMIGTGIGIIVIMADDATGVGIANDVTLPALFGAFAKGAQIVYG